MLELKDFDTIRMYPGDTLVLRAREDTSSEQMKSFMNHLKGSKMKLGFNILLVPYDFELFRLKREEGNA